MGLKARIFNIMQYERHPKTGEVLISESKIKEALAHKTIKRWAYVCHDRDVYLEKDELLDSEHVAGTKKPRHWHVVIEMGTNLAEVTTIAKWFGIQPQYVEVAKGAGAFLDCCKYLTHEDDRQQVQGKMLYTDSEIYSNFPYREELNRRAEMRAKYGKDLTPKDEIRSQVLYNGLSLRQLADENPAAYMDDYKTLEAFRYKYITKYGKVPTTRINYYVCGEGGIGKGLICKAIARALYPGIKDDEDIYFEVGAKGAPFEGYDGQPVIIWNDRRAYDLIEELHGRGNVFNVFDTHPTRQRQNIKYGSIGLINEVNIVNSVQPYEEFLDGLAGEYKEKNGNVVKSEDKSQSYRRFPFIIPVHEDDFDLLINRGFFEGTREYLQYIRYNNIQGNMKKILEVCAGREELARKLSAQTVKLVTDKHHEVVELIDHQTQISDEEVMGMFADYGIQMQLDDEPEQKKPEPEEPAKKYDYDENDPDLPFPHYDENGNKIW